MDDLIPPDYFVLDAENMKAYNQKPEKVLSEKMNEVVSESINIITKNDFKSLICPYLDGVSDEINDIAKKIVPVLYGAAIAGKIIIPLVPATFAVVVLVIVRVGIKNICDGFK